MFRHVTAEIPLSFPRVLAGWSSSKTTDGCFTVDSFPVFDHFHENATVIADSNCGWKMNGVGQLIADEIFGKQQDLLDLFRFARFEKGKTPPRIPQIIPLELKGA